MANIALAIEMAKKSKMDLRHGAVLFTGSPDTGKVFSTGYNQNITSKIKCFSLNHLCAIHAEMDCLLKCRNIFSFRKTPKETRRKFNMIVIRLKQDGLGESKPCALCHNFLKKFRIKKVYYSTSSGNVIMMKVNDTLNSEYITKGLFLKMKDQKILMSVIMGFLKKKKILCL